VQTAVFQVPLAASHATPGEHSASAIPAQSVAALQQAMRLEGVPDSWQPGLRFIMAQESSGKVDARSPVHSARGLFQLTAANYHLNPRGAGSFGNAVEEAQGGIRYIQERYGTADNAVAFWHQHRWY
jgi:SLT domain-containing protein